MNSLPTVRPWKEFFDISKISVPNPAKLQERMAGNLIHFSGNYLALFACSFIFTCLINPFLMFGVIFSAIGGLLLRKYLQNATESFDKDKKHLKDNTAHTLAKWYIYSVVMFLLLMGNIPLFVVLFFYVGGLLAHCAIRDPYMKGKNATHLMDICLRLDPMSSLTRLIQGDHTSYSKVVDMDKNK